MEEEKRAIPTEVLSCTEIEAQQKGKNRID